MKRFCPGCAQRRLQMNAAPCEMCGRVSLVEAPKARDTTALPAKILSALLRPLGRVAHAWTLGFCAFMVWSMALHGITEFMGANTLGILFTGLIVMAIWTIRLGTRALVWGFAPATRAVKRPGARTFLFLPACLSVLALLNAFDLPLRTAFWLSKPGLERGILALKPDSKGEASSRFRPGLRVGLYRMQALEVRKQNARLEVTDDDFLWSGTKAGFAKCPGGCQNAGFPSIYARGEGAKYIPLAGDWFWWQEYGSNDD